MTGLLRDLMEDRADGVSPPMLDLDAIIATGDKRVRRRRTAVGVGIGAVAAAVLGAVAFSSDVTDKLGDKAPPVKKPLQVSPFVEQRPTYASGSAIHFGADTVNVGPEVITSFTQTSDGFVFTTPQHEVFATDGTSMLQIGMAGTSPFPGRLVSDGPHAAWIDYTAAAPELVVYDTAADEEVVRTAIGSKAGGQDDDFTRTAVIAIDGDLVYWHNTTGVVATDITSGDTTSVRENASADYVQDVENGVFAMTTDEGPAVAVNTEVGASTPDDPFVQGSIGFLSPEGSRVATEGGDQVNVFDVETLAEVTPPHGDANLIVFLNWIDEDRYAELFDADPTDADDSYSLRSCSIDTGNCLVSESGIAPVDQVLRPDGLPRA